MTRFQPHKLIVFTNANPHFISSEYEPKPATIFLPEWYKKMENHFPINEPKNYRSTETIKKCIPVFDALTSGYIFQTVCDIAIEFKEGEPFYTPSITETDIINMHVRKQAYKHPAANDFNFPKFKNFWSIKTPKGYSCLFVPPLHNPNPYFTAMPAVVDTDTYNGTVNFPFVLNDPTKNVLIPAGTPIIQVIPFKRDDWKAEYAEDTRTGNLWFNKVTASFFGSYKNKYWSRKTYK